MEKEVLVLMLLSVFSLMSVALSPTKNYILERQMLDACGIQAIANISRMQWQSSKDHVLRGYDFAYDGLNRLEESTYAEGADMSQNKSSFDNNQNPTFHYYEKDHLGSIRMVVNENGTIEQENHYYPFGGVYGDLSYNAEIQKSKYIGKEFDHMHGLDLYDHGARMYDAARVVWDRVDKFCEKTPNLGVFLYCQNNPIIKFDPNGKEIIDLLSSSKEDEPLKYDISKFTDEANVINIWAHGYSDGFYSLGITDAKSFNIMLNQNSKVWKTHSDNKQVVIVLHSCKTADFARKLSESKLFKDVLIIAPNKNVQVRYEKNKLKRILTGVSDYEGKNVRTLKKSTGYWMGYKNGEFYNKYSGDFKTPNQNSEKPGAKGFDYDTWWQIIYKFFQQMIN